MGDAASAVTTFRQLGGSFAVTLFGILEAISTQRLTLEGYDRTMVGTRSMQDVVLVMFLIDLGCLVLSRAIPNRIRGPDVTLGAPNVGRLDNAEPLRRGIHGGGERPAPSVARVTKPSLCAPARVAGVAPRTE